MATCLTIFDETTGGGRCEALVLSLPHPTITVRELIRTRIFEEVQRFNLAAPSGPYVGFVQPTDAEVAVKGVRVRPGRKLDWHQQAEAALAAFAVQRLLVLVDDRQALSLDQEIEVHDSTEVTFLNLVPLVGG